MIRKACRAQRNVAEVRKGKVSVRSGQSDGIERVVQELTREVGIDSVLPSSKVHVFGSGCRWRDPTVGEQKVDST